MVIYNMLSELKKLILIYLITLEIGNSRLI